MDLWTHITTNRMMEKESTTATAFARNWRVQCLNGAHLGSARCALSESSGVERHKSFVLRIKFSAGRQF
jgi:hypothetical protein